VSRGVLGLIFGGIYTHIPPGMMECCVIGGKDVGIRTRGVTVYRPTVGTCEASRFYSNSNRTADSIRFDSKVIGRFENFRMESTVPALLLVVRLGNDFRAGLRPNWAWCCSPEKGLFLAFKRPIKRFRTPIGPYSLRHNHLLLNAVTFKMSYSWMVQFASQ